MLATKMLANRCSRFSVFLNMLMQMAAFKTNITCIVHVTFKVVNNSRVATDGFDMGSPLVLFFMCSIEDTHNVDKLSEFHFFITRGV